MFFLPGALALTSYFGISAKGFCDFVPNERNLSATDPPGGMRAGEMLPAVYGSQSLAASYTHPYASSDCVRSLFLCIN